VEHDLGYLRPLGRVRGRGGYTPRIAVCARLARSANRLHKTFRLVCHSETGAREPVRSAAAHLECRNAPGAGSLTATSIRTGALPSGSAFAPLRSCARHTPAPRVPCYPDTLHR